METIEKNKIIAEFMDYEGQHEDWCGNNILDSDDFQGEFMRPFRPESNWYDLMPVVEKISQYRFDDGDTAYPRTFGMLSADSNKPLVRINRFSVWEGSTLIEATYNAVYEFILFHNNRQ